MTGSGVGDVGGGFEVDDDGDEDNKGEECMFGVEGVMFPLRCSVVVP